MHINKQYQLESMKIKDLVRKNIEELTPYSSARDEFKSTSDFIYLDANESHYGERTIETIELTMEKEKKEREKEFKKNFDLVKLESSAWTIEVPLRKK